MMSPVKSSVVTGCGVGDGTIVAAAAGVGMAAGAAGSSPEQAKLAADIRRRMAAPMSGV
jgi:ribose 5-phosphate isomerase RpiB